MILHYCNPSQRLTNESPGTIGSALFVLWLVNGEAALASCCGAGFVVGVAVDPVVANPRCHPALLN